MVARSSVADFESISSFRRVHMSEPFKSHAGGVGGEQLVVAGSAGQLWSARSFNRHERTRSAVGVKTNGRRSQRFAIDRETTSLAQAERCIENTERRDPVGGCCGGPCSVAGHDNTHRRSARVLKAMQARSLASAAAVRRVGAAFFNKSPPPVCLGRGRRMGRGTVSERQGRGVGHAVSGRGHVRKGGPRGGFPTTPTRKASLRRLCAWEGGRRGSGIVSE